MTTINIIGSSSCRFFFKNCKNKNNSNSLSEYYTNILFNNLKCNGLIISGISIYGLDNKKSKTDSINEIDKFLKKNNADYTIFYIGEVDLEFLIWYRNQKYNESIQDLLNILINKLKIFIFSENNTLLH